MTTFNDLIAELARENLLDEIKLAEPERMSESQRLVNAVDPEVPLVPPPDLLTFSADYDLKLPDFSVLQPEGDPHFEENQLRYVFPTEDPAITFQNTQNLIKYQSRRRIKTNSKASKNCPTCGYKISALSLTCRFCKHRVVDELYYYSIIILGFTIFTIFVWLLITSKTYN